MIPAEGILAGVVERQYARDAYGVLQRDGQRGTQPAGLGGIVRITRFHGRIAVDDGLTGFRYPARHALAHGDFERREEAGILAIYADREQAVAPSRLDENHLVMGQGTPHPL